MSQNTDVLSRGFDAFTGGDTETVMATFADDIRWEGPNSEDLPGGGVHEGKEAVMQALGRIFESWESFSATIDEFVEQGDAVVVLGHTEGRTRAGNDIKTPFVHIWRMRDGHGREVQVLSDTLEVARALEIA